MNTKEFAKIFSKEVDKVLSRFYNKKSRICPQCNKHFKRSNVAHFFCSIKCYSKYHRIPGLFRKRMKEVTD